MHPTKQLLIWHGLPGRNVIAYLAFCFVFKVRFVMQDAIKQQLGLGNIVLLSNLGECTPECQMLSLTNRCS